MSRSALLLSLALSLLLALLLAAPAAAQPLVVLDPGHGGSDPGAVGCSLEEEDVVLDVMQRLRVLLEAAGVRVAMTRDADTTVGLSARATFANSRSATVFVSMHSNANAGTPATGTETFVMTGSSARTRSLGRGVQDAVLAAWSLTDRGLKEANFAVLRETSMPATLGELAFTNRCSPDAALLGDPTARQRAAEHLSPAILAWLGVTPTMPSTGTLRGVVFEDQGVGTEDITVRLPGASVRVTESGASASAAAGDAAWSFTLAPGDYTVEASNAGHVTATRRCTVTAGATTWCSVGLLPDAPAETDAGVPPIDEDAGWAPADAGPERDAGAAQDGGAGRDAGGEGREPVAGCGCAVGGRPVGGRGDHGGWLALAGVLGCLAVRRRRGLRLGAVVAILASLGVGCARDAGVAAGALAGDPLALEPAIASPLVVSLGEAREWLAPGTVAPQLSPQGTHVLLASEDHRALFVADLAGDGFREVCRVGRCGWEARWQDDGAAIAYRVEGQSGTAVPADAVTLAGEPVPPRVGERGVHAWVDDDDRAWLRIDGRTRALAEGERVLMPQLTADRRHVVLWGMTDGVLVHDVEARRTVRLGAGGHPRVDASGRWLVFERTEDDGHTITSADLFVVDLADPSYAVTPLVVGADALERMPSLSRIDAAGTGTLAYMIDGALVVRSIELARRD